MKLGMLKVFFVVVGVEVGVGIKPGIHIPCARFYSCPLVCFLLAISGSFLPFLFMVFPIGNNGDLRSHSARFPLR